MKRKNKIRYYQTFFDNRWRERHPESNWVIFGIAKRCLPTTFSYRIYFFGFDVSIWFKVVEPD